MLWVVRVLSGECGALAKDVSHYGGILISPVLLHIVARGVRFEKSFHDCLVEVNAPHFDIPKMKECFMAIEHVVGATSPLCAGPLSRTDHGKHDSNIGVGRDCVRPLFSGCQVS